MSSATSGSWRWHLKSLCLSTISRAQSYQEPARVLQMTSRLLTRSFRNQKPEELSKLSTPFGPTVAHSGGLCCVRLYHICQVCPWCSVLLTDESRFILDTCDRQERARRRRGDRFVAGNIIQQYRSLGGPVSWERHSVTYELQKHIVINTGYDNMA